MSGCDQSSGSARTPLNISHQLYFSNLTPSFRFILILLHCVILLQIFIISYDRSGFVTLVSIEKLEYFMSNNLPISVRFNDFELK